jgi:integrase
MTSVLWAHAKILEWGRRNGWDIPDYAAGVSALPDGERARRRADAELRRPLAMTEVARVAAHLHVVHQLVLWLMRVLGLRVSEAFGPRVGDIVDLGEYGLVVINRQGGRAFLVRNGDQVETVYSKDTLKRAASHRVVVAPPALMELLRLVIAAFHTDPVTGEVDLDARLVPWIVKEERGQSAFRFALDAALRAEGFGIDAGGLEVTSHDLRKSLATDLAWNAELDELAKRRVMGHKAGDDVFARVYTLDHPTLAPLTKVAAALQDDIGSQIGSLLIPTEQRVIFAGRNPLRERRPYVDAVLAEAGWLVEPGDADDPWCDTARVAAELGVAETTARRWMRDDIVPSMTDADPFGNSRRRARLGDVHAFKDRLATRILLRDLAAEIGVGYHLAWHALRRLGIEPLRDDRTDQLVLTPAEADRLRGEFARVAALKRRAMRISEAAVRLGVAVSTVKRLIAAGDVFEDPETDAAGARYVTVACVEALLEARSARVLCRSGLLSLATITELTGLSPAQVGDLVDRGLLQRRDVGRRFHVTGESVQRWAAGYRPDLLGAVDAVPRARTTTQA